MCTLEQLRSRLLKIHIPALTRNNIHIEKLIDYAFLRIIEDTNL